MRQELRAEDAAVDKNYRVILFFILNLFTVLSAQELPKDELQINISGYFDSFDVNVLYPSISLTSKVTETTSVNGRLLVDMITAASMRQGSGSSDGENEIDDSIRRDSRSASKVDAVSAASARGGYGDDDGIRLDDIRNEYNIGISQLFAGNLITLNGIYSSEQDYTSNTIAGTISRPFAMKNSTLQLGFVRSWDKIFPVTKDWTRSKDVVTYSANFSQLLNKDALVQILTSYTENNGYLADAYNQVGIDSLGTPVSYDPIHPQTRIRRAMAMQSKFRLNELSSMQVGYRYYWDNWDIDSHTFSVNYMRHLNSHIVLGLGWRTYLQNQAYFFKSNYVQPEVLMTSDIKLEKGYSNQLQLDLNINGGRRMDYLPFLTSEKVQYSFSLNIYQRHTQTGYWFNGLRNMIATNFNIGLRYRF